MRTITTGRKSKIALRIAAAVRGCVMLNKLGVAKIHTRACRRLVVRALGALLR